MTLSPPQRPASPDAAGTCLSSRACWAVLAAVLVAIALRAWEGMRASLWLDELHTLVHASQPSLPEVAQSVANEFHAPLFFLGVHLLGDWEQGAWLRVLPILSGLLLFLPVLAMARRTEAGATGAAVAAWVLGCAAFQVHFGAMLRPYAWLGCFAAAAVYLAFTERGPKNVRFVLFAAAVVLGLLTHKLMGVVVFSIGVARLRVRSPRMLGLGWLVLAGALAVAPTLPWFLGFAKFVTTARFEHQAEIGTWQFDERLIGKTLQLPLRMLAPYMASLGPPWSSLVRAGLVVFGGASLAGLALAVKARRSGQPKSLDPLVAGPLLYALVASVLITLLSIYSWDNLPLQYFTVVAWVVPLAAAQLCARVPGRWRVAVAAGMAAGALLTGLGQGGGASLEEMRRAVARARELGAQYEAPIYSAVLSQPSQFPHVLPYKAYAPELAAIEPEQVPDAGEPGFERPVIVIWRNLWYSHPMWVDLTRGRIEAVDEGIDWYLRVFVLLPGAQKD